jgi:hypothetical protein
MMVNNSTNINKMNNHLSLQTVKKKTMAYDIGNPCPDLGQPQKCVKLKLYNGIPAFPSVICVLEVSILSLFLQFFN